MKEVEFNVFSLKQLRKARNKIVAYKDELNAKTEELVKRLAERGVELAQARVPTDTGELKNSIHVEIVQISETKSIYAYMTQSDHAMYVEFGTGEIGRGTYPYPINYPWEYYTDTPFKDEVNGQKGWWVSNTWFCTGRVAVPYMAESAEKLRNEIVDIAKEVFGGDLK